MMQDMQKPLTQKDSNPMLESKRLIGLNGWLVLFQIVIIAAVALPITAYFMPIILPFEASDVIVREIIFEAILIIIAIICMICFYRRKMVFRILFIIFSWVTIVQICTNYIIYETTWQNWILTPVLIGLHVWIIVALFKSHRVKNTFS